MTIMQKETDNLLRWNGIEKGVYEVYFLKWNDAESKTAMWVRYTLTVPVSPDKKPYCELWGIFFDVEKPGNNFALKNRFPIYDLSWQKKKFEIRIADAMLTQTLATGQLEDSRTGHTLDWDISFDSISPTYKYFPNEFLYKGGFPKTKGMAPHSNGRFAGTVIANGRTIVLDDVPGQQAHLWGTKHAHRWAWGHCNAFAEDKDAVWEGLDAQVKIGPIVSPHLKLFYLRFDGRDHFFNAPLLWVMNKSDWKLGRWKFAMRNRSISVEGSINCEYEQLVAVTYTDPDGSNLWCNNSKVASIKIKVFDLENNLLADLTSQDACAAEFVDRVQYSEVPVRI